ncbi:hypothetical protein MNBD_ALPHA09-494 [hydrothermal vent metagenome]|uniref:Major facilitator superfamily (MFS) profile domain-containing protein n=1 Tax=hydrothermal vent metagenome TaxID=652676 RepID=A0A3B0TVR4_9ZZZZ
MIYALTLGPFALSYLLSYLLRAVNAVVAPDLVADVGLDAAELGALTAAYLLAFAAFQIPLGVLLDRYGPRRVQSALLVVAALGSALFSIADSVLTLTAARALIGLGFAGGLMAAFKAVVQIVPESRRALANSVIMAFGGLGIVAATQPTELAVVAFGWRAVFLWLSLAILASATAVFFIVRETPRPDRIVGIGEQLRGVGQVFADAKFWRVAPVAMLTAGGHLGFQTLWAGPWFRDVAGYDRDRVAASLFLMGVAFLVGVLLTGVVADWFVRRGTGLLTVMAGFIALYIASEIPLMMGWTYLAMPAWFLFAMTGQASILAYPWLSSYFGAGLSGRANTAINLLIFAFAFLTQTAIGWVIDHFPAGGDGGYDPEAYRLSFVILLGAQVMGFIWFILGARGLSRA